jgi:hypothetical protein
MKMTFGLRAAGGAACRGAALAMEHAAMDRAMKKLRTRSPLA